MATAFERWEQTLAELAKNKAKPEDVEKARIALRQKVIEKARQEDHDDSSVALALSRFDNGTRALAHRSGLVKEPDVLTEDERFGVDHPVLGGIKQAAKELVSTQAQGWQRIAGSALRLANDFGENEKGTWLDEAATSMEDAQKSTDEFAGEGYATADGVRGFGKMGLQNAPILISTYLTGGAAAGATSLAGRAAGLAKTAQGAEKVANAARWAGAGGAAAAGFSGEYGDARQQTLDKFKSITPEQMRESKKYAARFKAREKELYLAGAAPDDAAKQAYEETVDALSEKDANIVGVVNSLIEFAAPGASKFFLGGGKLSSKSLANAKKFVNLDDVKDVSKQFGQEFLQEGFTSLATDDTRAKAMNDSVDWGQVGKDALVGGTLGAIMGGGALFSTGQSTRQRALAEIKAQEQQQGQDTQLGQAAQARKAELDAIRQQRPLTPEEQDDADVADAILARSAPPQPAGAPQQPPIQGGQPAGTPSPQPAPAPQSGEPIVGSNAPPPAPPQPAPGLSGVVQRHTQSAAPALDTVFGDAIKGNKVPDFTALAQQTGLDRNALVDQFNAKRTEHVRKQGLMDLAEQGDLNALRSAVSGITVDPQQQDQLIEEAVAGNEKRKADALAASQQQGAQAQQQAQQSAQQQADKDKYDQTYSKMLDEAVAALEGGQTEVKAFLPIKKKYSASGLNASDVNGVIEHAKQVIAEKQQKAASHEQAVTEAMPYLQSGDEASAVLAMEQAGVTDDADVQSVLKEANKRIRQDSKKPTGTQSVPAGQQAAPVDPLSAAVAEVKAAQAAGKKINLATIAKKHGVTILDVAKGAAAKPEQEALKAKPSQPLALPAPQGTATPGDVMVSRNGKVMSQAEADALDAVANTEKKQMRRDMAEEAGNPTGIPTGMKPKVEKPARTEQKAVLPHLILRTDGKPFPDEKQANRVLASKKLTETHEVVSVEGGKAISPKKAVTAKNQVDPEKDDILTAIAKLGGIDRAQAKSQGIDPADFSRRAGGIHFVFRKNGGKTLDGMAEALSEMGYPVTENGDYTINALLDALDAALRGSAVGTPMFHEAKAQAMYEEEAAQREIDAMFDSPGNSAEPDWLSFGADDFVSSILDGDITPNAVIASELAGIENERTVTGTPEAAGQKVDSSPAPSSGAKGIAAAAGGGTEWQQKGKGDSQPDSAVQDFGLKAQTEAERLAEEQRQAADLEAKRKEEEKARLKAQADREISSFTLTGSDLPADVAMAAGQKDLFAPRTRGEKEAEKNQPRSDATISDADYAQVVEAAKYLKDIVYSMDNLVGDDTDLLIALSSDLGKSGRDTILMDAFGIDRSLVHTINNQLDDRKPHKLRAVDMGDAFTMFPMLRNVVDDAKDVIRKREERRSARDAESKAVAIRAPGTVKTIIRARNGGRVIDVVSSPHNGTMEDMARVAKAQRRQAMLDHPDAGNGNSITFAEENGSPKWRIGDNGNVSEISQGEADAIASEVSNRDTGDKIESTVNSVMTEVRSMGGDIIGVITDPYSGNRDEIMGIAQSQRSRMFDRYPDASNMQSTTIATDGSGRPAWRVRPNMSGIEQIGQQTKDVAPDVAAIEASPEHEGATRITPEAAGDMKAGDIIKTSNGDEYVAMRARHDFMDAHPIVDGKPVVNRDSTVRFHLNPNTASAYPERNHAPVYMTGRNQYEEPVREMTEEGRAKDGKPIIGGDKFRTSSDRETTPYPHQKSEKYASQWLIDNATAEAEARGDDFNAPIFRRTTLRKNGTLTDADRDSMLMYLFGEQPKVVPSILKPLTEGGGKEQSDATQRKFAELSELSGRSAGAIRDAYNAKAEEDGKDAADLSIDQEILRLKLEKARKDTPANKKFDSLIATAADSPAKLQEHGIERVLDNAESRTELVRLRDYLTSLRPDKAEFIADAANDIGGDKGFDMSGVAPKPNKKQKANDQQKEEGESPQVSPNKVFTDAAAHEAATSPFNDTPEPTDAQKEAGNYKVGRIRIAGMDISIENPEGSIRSGTDSDGERWESKLSSHYGYFLGTVGADGDHVDVFVKPGTPGDFDGTVYVVDQVDPKAGFFDEHKVVIGAISEDDAKETYLSNYEKGWGGLGVITPMPIGDFKAWLVSGDTKKPLGNAKETPTTPESGVDSAVDKPASSTITDFGEKIGGARKDTAGKAGAKAKTGKTDDRPAWARRYEIGQIASDMKEPQNVGKWAIHDNKNLDWKKQARQVGHLHDTREEAEAAIPMIAVALKHRAMPLRDGKYEIWREVTDRKRVKVVDQTFDTREEAMRYMAKHAVEIIETNTTFGEANLPRPESTTRVGEARRTGNVRDADFVSAFGFRAVEFGNWNNQAERQDLLNDAYDALLDLAEVMGIPPKGISLNGELALAFGARGHGLSGARAHYERNKAVINLTKMNGAGSLAHEWFHSLDHYFGRQDGKSSSEWVVGNDGTRSLKASLSADEDYASAGMRGERSGIRAELQKAYRDVMVTMTKKAEKYIDDTVKADEFVGRTRDDVREKLDSIRKHLADQLDARYYKRMNKPASAEQLAEFDAIAERIVAGEELEVRLSTTDKKPRTPMAGIRWTNDALERISAIMKEVRGRQGFSSDQSGPLDELRRRMTMYSSRLKMLADAQASTEKTRAVPTEFAMNARELDQGRGQDYWTTPHEMAARAFQGYVEDKVAEKGGQSPFLNYAPESAAIPTPWGWKRPYPHGEERKAINAAFDRLVDTIEVEETEGGVKLYSAPPEDSDLEFAADFLDTSGANSATLTTTSAREILAADPVLSKAMPFIELKSATENIPAGAAKFLPAYHGSPFKFDKFSLDYMGKGEGAQAYGWGLYFAGKKAIADWYREVLSPFTDSFIPFQGREYDYSEGSPDAPALVSALADYYGVSRRAATGAVVAIRDNLGVIPAYSHYTHAVENKTQLQKEIHLLLTILRNGVEVKPKGQLYRVEIPEDDMMLHWDKPLSEQPESVRRILADKRTAKAFAKYATRNKGLIDAIGSGELEGWQAYQSLAIAMGNQEKASKFLGSIGISGIKYLDGASRSKGEGNYNYVVFDDKAVRILETYYSAGKSGGPEGYYHNGKITLFPENIKANATQTAEERLKWVAFHEVTHRGVANLAESKEYMEELRQAGKNPFIKNLAKKIHAKRQGTPYEVSMEVAIEEALAETWAALQTGSSKTIKAQYGLHFPLAIRPRAKSAIARFFEVVKRIYSKAVGRGLTNGQVADLLMKTHEAGMGPNGTNPSGRRDSFAGQSAQTADLTALDKAKQRIAAGEDAEAVRKDTGWHTGVDGKWRFEIDDSKAYIKGKGSILGKPLKSNADIASIIKANRYSPYRASAKLGSILHHPDLFRAYPDLADVDVWAEKKGSGSDGSFEPESNVLTVREDLSGSDAVSVIYHEIQHAIQENEGFATGGRVSTSAMSSGNYDHLAYSRLAGEVESRNTEARANMTDAERRATSPKSTADVAEWDQIVTFAKGLAEMVSDKPTDANLSEAQRQLNEQLAIADRMIAERGGLFAPNGERSKLNRMQWAQVRTANFKRWFGDWETDPGNASSVVDDNGEPKIVYHSGDSGLTEIRKSGRFGGIFVLPTGAPRYRAQEYQFFLRGEALSLDDMREKLDSLDDGGLSIYQSYISGKEEATDDDVDSITDALTNGSDYPDDQRVWDILGAIDEADAQVEIQRLRGKVAAKLGYGAVQTPDEHGMDTIMVTDSKQIKSATGNAGTFSGKTDDIRYSVPPAPGQPPGRFQFVSTAQQWMFEKWTKTLGTQLNTAMLEPLFKPTYDLVQRYLQHTNNDAYDAISVAPNLLGRLEDINDYGREIKNIGKFKKINADREAAAVPLFEGTRFDKKVYSDAVLKRVYNLTDDQVAVYREARAAIEASLDSHAKSVITKILLDAGAVEFSDIDTLVNRDLPADDYMEELRQRLDTEILAANDAIAIQKTALSAAGVTAQDKASIQASIKKGSRRVELLEEAAKRIDSTENTLSQLKREGYFPLMRWGKYTVTVTDAGGKVVDFRMVETIGESKKLEAALTQQYHGQGMTVEKGSMSENRYKNFTGISPETLALFAKEWGVDNDEAYQEYLKLALPGQSALKRRIHRKGDNGEGIAGFSMDIQRTLAAFVMGNARHSARNIYGSAITQAVEAIPKNKGTAYDVAFTLADFVTNPDENSASVSIRNMLFIWNMGFSVAFGALNLTQPWMMTLPWLSQFSGAVDVAGFMGKAAKTAAIAQKNGTVPQEYYAEYQRAVREGHVDPQNVFMLQGIERGGSGLGSSLLKTVSHGMGMIAAATESYNRKLTLFAALDVARAKGPQWLKSKGFDSAYDFAVQAVAETQGVYNKGNRPGWSRNPIGAVLLVFKQYAVNWIEMAVRMGRNHYGDDRMRKGLMMMLGLLFAMAGGMGMPFAEDLKDIAETAMGMAGKPINIERQMQMTLGKGMADTVLAGPINAMVFNSLGLDMHGRMSMGNLIPGTGALNPYTSTDAKLSEGISVMGAGTGLLKKASDSIAAAQDGRIVDAVQHAAPRSVESLMKGVRMMAEGKARDSRGNVLMETTPWDAAAKMIDFQPASVAITQRERGRRFQDKNIQMVARKSLRDRLITAYEEKDADKIRDAEQALDEWNQDNPLYQVKLKKRDLRRAAKKRGASWMKREETPKGLEWMDEYADQENGQ